MYINLQNISKCVKENIRFWKYKMLQHFNKLYNKINRLKPR